MSEQQTERQILTIEEDKFYLDSVTEEGKQLIGTINAIVAEQERLKVQMGIAGISYDTILAKLKEESKNFAKAE